MANYYLYFSSMLNALNEKEVAWARTELKRRAEPDDESGSSLMGFVVDFEVTKSGADLWIHDDGEYGNVDNVIDFVQLFLKKFRPKEGWGFEWSNGCSKPRLDAFGGGAGFITATKVTFMNTGTWLAEAEKAWEEAKKQCRASRKSHKAG